MESVKQKKKKLDEWKVRNNQKNLACYVRARIYPIVY